MPEVLGSPPSPRTALFWNGTAWQWALVDAAGHLQIDALSTVMDPLAATAANQVIINTTVGLVALIRNALQTVQTDRLIVRGQDQLFSFKGVLATTRTADISGAGGYVDSTPCSAGEIWCVTNITAVDTTSPTTAHDYSLLHDAVGYGFGETVAALAAAQWTYWGGFKWLDPEDTIRVYFVGGLAADSCIIRLTGYRMTLET